VAAGIHACAERGDIVTPDQEQYGDEAIELRCTNVEGAIGHLHIPTANWEKQADHLDNTRRLITRHWDRQRPALAALADQRAAGIARLAEQGITPEDGCTVTVGRVTLEAVRDQPPVDHRYRIMRGREQAGWAWLSTWHKAIRLHYIVLDEDGDRFYGRGLREALARMAGALDDLPLTEAGAR
jgi:hypothetical protein